MGPIVCQFATVIVVTSAWADVDCGALCCTGNLASKGRVVVIADSGGVALSIAGTAGIAAASASLAGAAVAAVAAA